MRTIAHISDLHFGAEDPRAAAAILADLREQAPALVAVSGDLTQRARPREFRAARAFLDALPAPSLVVPGNHDVPLFDLVRRFGSPLARYREHITDDLAPLHCDGELCVLGVNTARSLTWKAGRISHDQIEHIRERFCAMPHSLFKVVVTHHQFVPSPHDGHGADVVGRGGLAIHAIDRCGIDLLLAGHLHRGYSGDARAHYPSLTRSVVVVQAGTAISHRVRGEGNAYNVITVARDRLEVRVRSFDGARFAQTAFAAYDRRAHEWLPALGEARAAE